MLSKHTLTPLLRIAVALALPTVMCFSYYSLSAVDEQSGAWPVLVTLCYPIAILGMVGVVATLLSPRPSRLLWLLTGLCLLIPATILMYVRLIIQ